MRQTRRIGGVFRLLRQFGQPQKIAKPSELPIIAHRYNHMPIAHPKHLIRHNIRVPIAAPLGHLPSGEEIHPLIDKPGHLRVHQSNVDMLPLSAATAVEQSRQNPYRCIKPAYHIGDANAHFHGHAIWRAGQAHDAAKTLRHQIIARLVAIGTRLPIARKRAINQRGIGPAQCFCIQPVFLQPAGFEVLNQHIGARRQLADQPLPLCCGDVHCNRLLVAIGCHEVGA